MTRTAATLLVGMAVSAVAGCVAPTSGPTGPPAAHQQPPTPRQPPLPRLAGKGGQPEQLVEAPAHEVLEAAMLPAERSPGPAPRPAPGPAREHGAPPAPRAEPPVTERPARRAAAPEADAPRHRTPHRRAGPPPALPDLPASAADVCALGDRFGGWNPNSPEARICRDTYGG